MSILMSDFLPARSAVYKLTWLATIQCQIDFTGVLSTAGLLLVRFKTVLLHLWLDPFHRLELPLRLLFHSTSTRCGTCILKQCKGLFFRLKLSFNSSWRNICFLFPSKTSKSNSISGDSCSIALQHLEAAHMAKANVMVEESKRLAMSEREQWLKRKCETDWARDQKRINIGQHHKKGLNLHIYWMNYWAKNNKFLCASLRWVLKSSCWRIIWAPINSFNFGYLKKLQIPLSCFFPLCIFHQISELFEATDCPLQF